PAAVRGLGRPEGARQPSQDHLRPGVARGPPDPIRRPGPSSGAPRRPGPRLSEGRRASGGRWNAPLTVFGAACETSLGLDETPEHRARRAERFGPGGSGCDRVSFDAARVRTNANAEDTA